MRRCFRCCHFASRHGAVGRARLFDLTLRLFEQAGMLSQNRKRLAANDLIPNPRQTVLLWKRLLARSSSPKSLQRDSSHGAESAKKGSRTGQIRRKSNNEFHRHKSWTAIYASGADGVAVERVAPCGSFLLPQSLHQARLFYRLDRSVAVLCAVADVEPQCAVGCT